MSLALSAKEGYARRSAQTKVPTGSRSGFRFASVFPKGPGGGVPGEGAKWKGEVPGHRIVSG
jgi:hypothetical protein